MIKGHFTLSSPDDLSATLTISARVGEFRALEKALSSVGYNYQTQPAIDLIRKIISVADTEWRQFTEHGQEPKP